MLRNKEPAPHLALPDAAGAVRSLSELCAGRPFLLLFLRFAECPTTQRDLLRYANVYSRVRLIGADMAAVTVEHPDAHRELGERLGLPYPLLSDADFSASERWGVYRSDETDEGPQPHGEPAVFLIAADGTIAYSQVTTGPKGLADPAELTLVLLYMAHHGGRYW